MNPLSPESARSNLQRYLRGAVLPSIEKRHELAIHLGVETLKSVPDPDDEEADLVADLVVSLRRFVRDEMAKEPA
jgi:transcriptional regulator with XRE-family HTH domain